jgi:predicted DsbA family dithiol-disulfide isomerase
VTTDPSLHITVVSDVVCPWCFIGQRHLRVALADWAHRYPQRGAPEIEWSAFQLNPDMPRDGVDRGDYVRRKFGARHDEIMARMAEAGANAGIAFDWSKVVRQPNTLALHALILGAETPQMQGAIAERLFEAFFLEGVDVTDPDSVAVALAPLGVDASSVANCWDAGGELQKRAAQADQQWRQNGIQGVPLFVFNRKWAVSGAQPPEQLVRAMEHAFDDAEASHEPQNH